MARSIARQALLAITGGFGTSSMRNMLCFPSYERLTALRDSLRGVKIDFSDISDMRISGVSQ